MFIIIKNNTKQKEKLYPINKIFPLMDTAVKIK